MGADPLDRPRILEPLWRAFRVGLPLPVIGIVDVALWDLGARAATFHRGHARAPARAPPWLRERPARGHREGLRSDGGRTAGSGIPGRQAPRLRRSRNRHRGMPGRPKGGRGRRRPHDGRDGPVRPAHGPVARLRAGRARLPLVRGPAPGRGPGRLEGAEAPARDAHRGGRLGTVHGAGLWSSGRLRGLRHRSDGCGETASPSCAPSPISPPRWGCGAKATASAPPSGRPPIFRPPCPSPTVTSSSSGSAGGLDVGVHQGLRLDDDGFVVAPDGPGLGLELDRDALADRRISVD